MCKEIYLILFFSFIFWLYFISAQCSSCFVASLNNVCWNLLLHFICLLVVCAVCFDQIFYHLGWYLHGDDGWEVRFFFSFFIYSFSFVVAEKVCVKYYSKWLHIVQYISYILMVFSVHHSTPSLVHTIFFGLIFLVVCRCAHNCH